MKTRARRLAATSLQLLLGLALLLLLGAVVLGVFVREDGGQRLTALINDTLSDAAFSYDRAELDFSFSGVHLRAHALEVQYHGNHINAAQADFILKNDLLHIDLLGADITLQASDMEQGAPLAPAYEMEISAEQARIAFPAHGITLPTAEFMLDINTEGWKINLSQKNQISLHARGNAQGQLRHIHAQVEDFPPLSALALPVQMEGMRATLLGDIDEKLDYHASGTFERVAAPNSALGALILRQVAWSSHGNCTLLVECLQHINGTLSMAATLSHGDAPANAPANVSDIAITAAAAWEKRNDDWRLSAQAVLPFTAAITPANAAATSALLTVVSQLSGRGGAFEFHAKTDLPPSYAPASAAALTLSGSGENSGETWRISITTALPLPYRPSVVVTLNADTYWKHGGQHDEQQWTFAAPRLQAAHGGATVQASASAGASANARRTLFSVSGSGGAMALTAVQGYFPDGELHEWFADSLLGGTVSQFDFAVSGDTQSASASPAALNVRATAEFADGTLAIAEGWQPAESLHGTLHISNDLIDIRGRGVFDGLTVPTITARIPDIHGERNTLFLDIHSAQSPFSVMIAAARRTPATGGFMRDAEDTLSIRNRGQGQLRLQINVPLAQPQQSRASAVLTVTHAALQAKGLPPYTNIYGEMHFSNDGYDGALHGWIGNDLSAPPLTAVFNHTALTLQGNADVSVLLSIAAVENLPLSGSTSFTVSRTADATVFSTMLEDTVIDLPYPVGKDGNRTAPFTLHVLPDGARAHFRNDYVTININTRGEGTDIAVNRPAAAPPARGINLHGSTDTADLDLWLGSINPSGGENYLSALHLTIAQATFLGDVNADFIARGGSGGKGQPLSLHIHSSHHIGSVVVDGQQMRGDFARLSLPLGDNDTAGGSKDGTFSLSVALTAAALLAGELTLGALMLAGAPQGEVWQLHTLHVHSPDVTLNIGGTYEDKHTFLTVQLDVASLPSLLSLLHIPPTFGGGRASLYGLITWPGAPTDFSMGRMNGNIRLSGEDVQYLNVAFGTKIVNFLSIFSLQSLLQLGFTELGEGVVFGKVEGEIDLANGEAMFNPINMISRDFRMDIQGTTDYLTQEHDLHGKVRPGEKLLSASSVVGLGTGLVALQPTSLVAAPLLRQLFGDSISEIGAYHYTITGTWEDPTYKEVGREDGINDTGGSESPSPK